MKKQLFALSLCLASAMTLFAQNPTIYGVTGNGYSPGVYKFQATAPGTTEVIYTYSGMNPDVEGGVFMKNHIYYVENPESSYSKPSLKGYNYDDGFTNWTNDPWVDNLPNTSTHTALAQNPIDGKVYGCFYNSDKSANFFGTIDLNEGDGKGMSTKIKDLDTKLVAMAFSDLGVLYAIDANGILLKGNVLGNFVKVKEQALNPRPRNTVSSGAVIDPTDGTMYLSTYDSNYDRAFYKINVETGEMTKIGNHSGSSIHFQILYIEPQEIADAAPAALSNFSATSEGFSTDLNISFTTPSTTMAGAAWNPGLKAYIAIDGEFVLNGEIVGPGMEINRTYQVTDGIHAVVAYVTDVNGNYSSPKSSVNAFVGQDTPEPISDLQFTVGSDNVVLTWAAPENGANGGNFDVSTLKYKVTLLPDDEVLTDELTDCTYTYNFEGNDLRKIEFTVIPITGGGDGEPTSTGEVIIGEDLPGQVNNLSLVEGDNGLVISWEPPTEGAQGGNFDESSLTYSVYLMPDTELITGLTECTYTYVDTNTDLHVDQFKVVASTSKGDGSETLTAALVVGDPMQVPYTQDFDGVSNFDEIFFTIIDSNDDTKTWQFYNNSQIRYPYHNSNKADDWAVTPPILLREGHEYSLDFDVILSNPNWGPENMEIMIGKAPSADELTESIMENTTYSEAFKSESLSFTVSETGVYYIGFHCISAGNKGYLALDNINVDYSGEETGPTDVPAAAADFTASLIEDTSDVVLTFTVPTMDAAGGNHPHIDSAEIYCNGELIKKFKYPAEGSSLSHTDLDKDGGEYEYSVLFRNSMGASEESKQIVLLDTTTSVSAIGIQSEGYIYFDLNGIQMKNADKLAPGVYIRIKDNKSEKVMIRK